jgi:hypothetical protein
MLIRIVGLMITLYTILNQGVTRNRYRSCDLLCIWCSLKWYVVMHFCVQENHRKASELFRNVKNVFWRIICSSRSCYVVRVMSMLWGRSDACCGMVGNAHGLLQVSGPVGTAVQRGKHVSLVRVKFTVLSAWHMPLMRWHFDYILSLFRRVLNRVCSLFGCCFCCLYLSCSFARPSPQSEFSSLTFVPPQQLRSP